MRGVRRGALWSGSAHPYGCVIVGRCYTSRADAQRRRRHLDYYLRPPPSIRIQPHPFRRRHHSPCCHHPCCRRPRPSTSATATLYRYHLHLPGLHAPTTLVRQVVGHLGAPLLERLTLDHIASSSGWICALTCCFTVSIDRQPGLIPVLACLLQVQPSPASRRPRNLRTGVC